MKFHGFAIVLVLIFAVHTYGQRTDVVVMKNGDRLTCEITGLKYGTLFVKLDYVDGTVEINWAKVAKVESNRLFIVKTEDGKVREGQISTAETDVSKAVRIDVKVDADTTVELETTDVVKIDTSSDRFWKRFNGSVNLGLNYSKGNNATQYNLNSSVEYPRERWGIEANLDSTLSSNDGSETSTRNELRTKVYRLLRKNNLYATGGFGILQSTEQGISRQVAVTGGLGYFLTNSNRSRIAVIGGIAVQRTTYDRPGIQAEPENEFAGMVGTEIRYFKFKKTGLNLAATLMPSFSEPGRVFFKVNQDYYVKIFSNLTWNISFYGGWDNRPPFGLSGSDYGMNTGLGWTFGNR